MKKIVLYREEELQNESRPPNDDVQMHLNTLTLPQKEENFDCAFRIDSQGNVVAL